jgi:cyclic pyranopterin phosphate synthase
MQLQTGEIGSVIRILAGMGIKKVRFTGGEPLLRPDIVELVRTAKAISGIETVKITTNGVLLDRNLEALLAAGIDGINLSLDTLDRDRYLALTRRDEFRRVEKMLYELLGIPSLKLKINVLLLRGVNSDEIRRFAELTRHNAITVRFMELQPFDDRQIWRTGRFMGADLIRSALFEEYPSLTQVTGSATEHFSFSMPGYKGMLAVIPAYTRNFCSRCTRLRITADGKILSCLYSSNSENLLLPLRNGAGRDELEKIIRRAVEEKPEDGRKTGNNSRGTSMSEIGG